jgi:fatty-acyl-CoA synthase
MGKPLDGMEVQIVNPESGNSQSTGEEGEILVRGWAMMEGYHDPAPDVPAALDDSGWYHTGDLGRLDREGYVTYLGRVQERLRVGGENVVPEEVSLFLRRHPQVEAAEVFGIPDARLGEIPAAVIQRKPGASFSASEVQAYCRERIAGFKIPQHIRFVDQMPISASHKVDRRKLRQELLEGLDIEPR